MLLPRYNPRDDRVSQAGSSTVEWEIIILMIIERVKKHLKSWVFVILREPRSNMDRVLLAYGHVIACTRVGIENWFRLGYVKRRLSIASNTIEWLPLMDDILQVVLAVFNGGKLFGRILFASSSVRSL
jgi:hypothetical protein